jgi:hypothetical protein
MMATVGTDPPPEATEARRLSDLARVGDEIIAGVERTLGPWMVSCVARILEAWGRSAADVVARALATAEREAPAVADRIARSLRELFAQDPSEQTRTPLEIVRTAIGDPTRILVDAGVPPVERDAFEERTWPEDRYDLLPRTLADLGDPDLGPLQLAWGLAKAGVLRARAEWPGPNE